MLAQACIGYDIPQTFILTGMCAGRIILVSCILILKCVTMARFLGKTRDEFGNIDSVE